jgi:hypothetical protein
VLQRWPTDFTSTYQILLATKIAFVAGMTGLAVMNRYIFVPRMLTERDRAIMQIRNGTYAELVLGAGVLALVAFLVILARLDQGTPLRHRRGHRESLNELRAGDTGHKRSSRFTVVTRIMRG